MRRLILICLALLALPVAAAVPEVRATPARVVLGQDMVVQLEVRVPTGTGPVRAIASSGTFTQPVVEGGVLRTFQWTPPEVRYPLPAVLLFWVSTPQGPPEVAVVHIPLLGRTTLPVTTDPGAEVIIEIAGAHFGPVKATRRGKAQVPVEVPPGLKEAHVLATRGELQTDRVVKLEAPDHRPLVALFSADPLPRSGGWLVVAGQEPLTPEAVELSVEGARLELVAGTPLRYRVLPSESAQSISVEVHRRQAPDNTRAQASLLPQAPVAPPQVAITAPPELPSSPSRLALHLLAGGFFAGGANHGPAVSLGLSYTLPLWSERLAVELEVGVRRASLTATVEGYGTLRSSVLAGPALASVRVALFQRSAFTLSGRLGAGVLPFQHAVSSELQGGFSESQLGAMGFLAAQAAWRLGSVSALVELRGEYGPARTSRVSAQLGGAGLCLGVRYRL